MQVGEVIEQVRGLSSEDQQRVLRAVAPIGGPATERTRDTLWLIVVVAFALVLVGAFATLAVGMFVKDVRPELLLSTFTSVVGFLAGLFVPSPAGDASRRPRS